MSILLPQFAQIDPEGSRGWGNLVYLLVILVIPLANAAKDWFVRRATEQQERRKGAGPAKTQGVPTITRVAPKHPTAKPLPTDVALPKRPGLPTTTPPQIPPVATPAPRRRPRPAVPSTAHKRPTSPPAHAAGPPAQTKRQAPRPQPPAGPQIAPAPAAEPSATRRRSVSGVDVAEAGPEVDLQEVDPTIHMRQSRAVVDVRAADPRLKVRDEATMAAAGLGTAFAGLDLSKLNPAQLQQAIVFAEVFGPPLALRTDPESGRGPWSQR